MDEILKRDENHVPVLGAITNDSDQFIKMLRIDPVTGRLMVSAVISGGGSSPLYYKEPTTAPAVAPVSTGVDAIAIGNNAVAAADGQYSIGPYAGLGSTLSVNSVFIGSGAGTSATNANASNFIGTNAGANSSVHDSNMFGTSAGLGANNANNSNFMGYQAGYNATGAGFANFFGYDAGNNASSATSSNFIGTGAGYSATNASQSNFFGVASGNQATLANDSNFIGTATGDSSTNAKFSNFIGYNAGHAAPDAANSIFMGRNAGDLDTVDNTTSTDDFSILIGNDITTGGFKNSVLIGSGTLGLPDTNTRENEFKLADRITAFRMQGMQTFADNADAIANGLVAGDMYFANGINPTYPQGIVMMTF